MSSSSDTNQPHVKNPSERSQSQSSHAAKPSVSPHEEAVTDYLAAIEAMDAAADRLEEENRRRHEEKEKQKEDKLKSLMAEKKFENIESDRREYLMATLHPELVAESFELFQWRARLAMERNMEQGAQRMRSDLASAPPMSIDESLQQMQEAGLQHAALIERKPQEEKGAGAQGGGKKVDYDVTRNPTAFTPILEEIDPTQQRASDAPSSQSGESDAEIVYEEEEPRPEEPEPVARQKITPSPNTRPNSWPSDLSKANTRPTQNPTPINATSVSSRSSPNIHFNP